MALAGSGRDGSGSEAGSGMKHESHLASVSTIGLREVWQQASESVREAEAGDPSTVTVSLRPVAPDRGLREPHGSRGESPRLRGARTDRSLIMRMLSILDIQTVSGTVPITWRS